MKILITYLLLFLSISLYGQVPECIQKADTLYLYFDYGKYQRASYTNANINKEKKRREYYHYKLSDYEYITLTFNEFWALEGQLSDVKTLKKSFLRKNKDIIITMDEIIKYGMYNVVLALYYKKIYIIDTHDIKKRNILAREVRFYNSFETE